ncbi:MAG TPA: hypothetical protein VGI81_24245 [Tepidisphaeraceae bacterium]
MGDLRLVDVWPGDFRGAKALDEQSLRQLTLLAAVLFAALPAAWIASTARAMRRAEHAHTRILAHQCGSCGYDLRASTDRCPECGTKIPHPPAPDIAEDLRHCSRCAAETWHVIRTYSSGAQRIECEACKLVTVDPT